LIKNSFTIEGAGEVWVNRGSEIAFINSDPENPLNARPQQFDVYIAKDNCENTPVILNIQNGGRFIIGDRNNAVNNTGQVYVMPSSIVNVKGGGELILEEDYNNTLTIQGGEDETGAPIPATLNIEVGGLVRAEWGSRIIVENQGVLRVKEGGILRISHYSDLEVKEGGKLIIEDGAIIQLWDGTFDPDSPNVYGRARIHIMKKGELVIDGNFDFSGNGFFEFDNGQKLTLNTPFGLEGVVRENRMIRLNDNCVLNVNQQGLDWSNGLIEYGQNSKIRLNEETFGHFSEIDFPGSEFSIAVEAEEALNLFFWRCSFFDWTSQAVIDAKNILGGTVGTPTIQFFTMNFSAFTNCVNGIKVEKFPSFSISNTTFTEGGNAIYAKQISNGNLRNVNVNNHFGGGPAVRLIGVPNTRATGCQFNENSTAISLEPYSPLPKQDNRSNIDLRCSEVNNNIIGVNVEEMSPGGMVTMTFSELICNSIAGVLGVDVVLNINEGRNHFEKCIGIDGYDPMLFDICFKNGSPNVIPATRNFWRYTQQFNPGPLPGLFNFKHDQTCDPIWNFPQVLGAVPLMQAPPCPQVEIPIPEYTYEEDLIDEILCSVTSTTNNQPYWIFDNFLTAENLFAEEGEEYNIAEAESTNAFLPTAMIANSQMTNLSSWCKTMVRIARSRIGYQAPVLNPNGNSNGTRFKETSKNQLGYPNPTEDTYTIPLEEGLNNLKMFDLFGKLIFEGDYDASVEMDMTPYEKGIYLIQIENYKTGAVETGKVVIQ